MTAGKPLNARLFLEGMEVPLIGATCTHTVDMAAISYIDIVPHRTINNIKARTLVHLFVRDLNNEKEGFPYVLAFEGEVFGFNFGKTPTSRMMTLSCIDLSSYWDNVISYFFNAAQSLGKGAEAIGQEAMLKQGVTGAGGVETVNVTHSTASFFKSILDEALRAVDADFLDALVAVYKRIADVNEFYKFSEERLRIVDRIKMKSSGKLSQLLSKKESVDYFMGLAGGLGGVETLRNVVNYLMNIIFHDFVSVPFPAVVKNKTIKQSSIRNTKDKTSIGEFIFKPNMYMVPPPICNIFFPDEYSSFNFSRNFFQEPTRLIYQPELPMIGGGGVSLLHVYAPASFAEYMKTKKNLTSISIDSAKTIGDGDLQVSKFDNWGHYGETTQNPSAQGFKREQQFLSNEEKMKGILISIESGVPAVTQFMSSLTDSGRVDIHRKIGDYLFFKKRFQGRDVSITSQLKMSIVPGFNVMIVDDSDAGQTVLAYCSSVTHRYYANQGGYTQTTLSYARTVDEQDSTSGKSNEPLVPPWFDEAVFGKKGKPPKSSDKNINTKVQSLGEQLLVPNGLSDFYKELLGEKGSMSINSYTKEPTVLGASEKILLEYKTAKSKGRGAVHSLIDKVTRRDYIKLKEAFSFIGATSPNENTSFTEFSGGKISGDTVKNSTQVKSRRNIVKEYRDTLKSKRGFHG